ncbi:MAG: hypothetical protein KC561_04925, partial [Myxococcales bacterium]|nr:hypothetical protein [Myxococcales bacterium]
LPVDRTSAYRLSLFRFGDQVGGVVRVYPIDGSLNTPDNPYNSETFCSYFGPFRLVGNTGRFIIEDQDGEVTSFALNGVDETQLNVTVDSVPADETEDALSFSMSRQDQVTADRQCDPNSAYQVRTTLPAVSVNDAPNLLLAAVYQGYEMESGDRRPNWVADAEPLARLDADNWAVSHRFALPSFPPSEGMSAFGDPEQAEARYSLIYFVLFDDGDTDGTFRLHFGPDRPLAVSYTRSILFIQGSPDALESSVAERVDPLCPELEAGFNVVGIEFDRLGEVTRICPGNTPDITLTEAVDDDLYPSLLPWQD